MQLSRSIINAHLMRAAKMDSGSNYNGWSERQEAAFTAARVKTRYGEALAPTQERAILKILDGLVEYADAHATRFLSSIGEDYVLGPKWAQIAGALRGLLDGELGRLDGGTIDGILHDAMKANGFDPEEY